jgi:hypothetical protein
MPPSIIFMIEERGGAQKIWVVPCGSDLSVVCVPTGNVGEVPSTSGTRFLRIPASSLTCAKSKPQFRSRDSDTEMPGKAVRASAALYRRAA